MALSLPCFRNIAVHLEIVPSWKAETWSTAFTRCMTRRGNFAIFLSDNGRNIVGAAKEMSDCLNAWNHSGIEEALLLRRTSSGKLTHLEVHVFLGFWKVLVRSCKNATIAVLDDRSLTEDVLITNM